MNHRISVFGLGHVGLVSAVCLANAGHDVVGVDIDGDAVRRVNEDGRSPVTNPDLDPLVGEMVRLGRFRATTSGREAVTNSDLAFVCVGVPGDLHGQLNLNALRRVCREIGEALHGREQRFTVAVRSTLLPGTLDNTVRTAILAGAGDRYEPHLRLAANPEFIREGATKREILSPSLNLVGCEDPETAALLREVYAGVEAPFVHTRTTTAEMVKYARNAFLALKACFANEIGDSCEALGVDAQEVMRIFSLDDRLNVSPEQLQPGFAFGGGRLARDVNALLHAAHHADVGVPLLDAIMPSKQGQIHRAVDALLATGKRRIGILGLASGPAIDHLHSSPALALAETLIGKGCDVRIQDRTLSDVRRDAAGRKALQEAFPHIAAILCDQAETLVEHAELLVIGTAGQDTEKLFALARPEQVIVDLTRNAPRLRSVAQVAA